MMVAGQNGQPIAIRQKKAHNLGADLNKPPKDGSNKEHKDSDKSAIDNSAPDTKIVTAGRDPEWTGPVVNTPVWRASTHLYDNCADLADGVKRGGDEEFFYGRRGSPTQWSLAKAITEMESPETSGAYGTLLFPSGVAAINIALLSVLKPGDVLLMSDNSYDPSRGFANGLLKRMGIETRFFDPLIGSAIEELFCANTKAILMESPGSLTFEITDIPAICAVAKKHNIITLLDNTWATSYFYPALEKGIDISIIAATKYIVGHSDVMMGSLTTHEKYWMRLRKTARQLGQVVSPDDAYLAARGLRTMAARLKTHEQSALKIAHWLDKRDDVKKVLHPALPSCPGHEIWKRDYKGSSGLFSFIIKGDKKRAAHIINNLNLYGIGFSWGGFESLALLVHPEQNRSATQWQEDGAVIRLQIGLEDCDDLITDLAQAMNKEMK